MPESVVNTQRIAKNTMMLYFRMFLLMGVSLYTSRVVLSALGIDDYGIYNVVGGFVGVFSFLNGAMSSCTQRYITFALGKNDEENLKLVFSTTLITHAIIALLVFVLAETVGLWLLLEKLVIPDDRMTAAMVVYQCSVLSALVLIMSFPYNADIIAHERMPAFAYISIFEAIAKLLIVFVLSWSGVDKLILYAILLLIVQFSVISIYIYYCRRHFVESRFRMVRNKGLVKEMFAFAGWNLWGGLASALFSQGVNILLNIFFGPAVNAARGVSMQVQNSVQQFSTNFQMAINPQITKSFAVGDLDSMHSLVFRSAKFTFFLLLCIALPISVEIRWILSVWLKEVPDYTSGFVVLMLAISIVDAISNPFMISAAATGRVKIYQSVVGGILLLIVPIAYVVLKLGGNPYTVFIVHFCVAILAFIARMFIVRPLINLSIGKYIAKVIVPCFFVLIISVICALLIKKTVYTGTVISSILVIVFCALSVCLCSYLVGLSRGERAFVNNKIRSVFHLNDRN